MDGAGPLPTFAIVGVPKAGTSSLAVWLSGHPEVFIPPGKELHYFNVGYDKGEAWYRSQFADAQGALAIGEGSPNYVFKDEVLDRMVADVPGIRTILLLRHPVDRAYSHYWYTRSLGYERRTFEQVVTDELRRHETRPFRHIGDGVYGPMVDRLEARLPAERRLVLLFDDLCRDPADTLRAACRFIGVADDPLPAGVGTVVNPTTQVRSRWLLEQMLKRKAWQRLPFGLADAIDRVNRVETRYPPLAPSLRRELLDFYRDDVTSLAERLGRDLSAWMQ